MQRGFDRRHGQAGDAADLLQRIAENVHQDDAAALRHRQPHEGAQACRGRLAIVHGGYGIGDHFRFLVGLDGISPGATQEIERGIVRDAEQPTLRPGDGSCLGQRLDRPQQRLLQEVLAVDDGAGHAGAIAVQLWPQLAKQPGESLACVRLIGKRRVGRTVVHAPSIR